MSAVWNPHTLFQVDEGSVLGMFCVGLERSNYNSRCRVVLPADRYNDIRRLLSSMSTRLPQKVTMAELRRLARLALCQYHGIQMEEIVAKWLKVLNCIREIDLIHRLQWEWSFRDLSECKSLLGVKEDSVEALPVILRQHINNDAQLEKDLVASQATCARLQKDLAKFKDQEEENSRLSAEKSRLSTLLKRAEEEQERYKNQETNLTTECEKLRKQNTELQADVESAKDKYKDLQGREQSATRELMATTAQLHEAQSLNLGLGSDKKTLQSEIDILKREVEKLNDKNTSLSSQLASTASSLETVTEELCAAHKENMGFRDELITATREIMELRNKVTQLSTPAWYRVIQWLKQQFSSLRNLRNPGKEMSDEEEGIALAPTVAARDAGPA